MADVMEAGSGTTASAREPAAPGLALCRKRALARLPPSATRTAAVENVGGSAADRLAVDPDVRQPQAGHVPRRHALPGDAAEGGVRHLHRPDRVVREAVQVERVPAPAAGEAGEAEVAEGRPVGALLRRAAVVVGHGDGGVLDAPHPAVGPW